MYLIWILLFLVTLWIILFNSAIIFSVVKYRRASLKDRQNVIIVNIFVVGLCRAFAIFVHVTASFADGVNEHNCHVFGFFTSFTSTLDWLATVVLLIDRLVFIRSPINYAHKMTPKAIFSMLCYQVIHALIVPLVGAITKNFKFHEKYRFCEIFNHQQSQELLIFGFVWNTLIPFISAIVVYVLFYNLLKHSIHKTRVHDTLRDTSLPLGFHSAIRNGGICKSRMSYLKSGKHLSGIFLFYAISCIFFCAAKSTLVFRQLDKDKGDDGNNNSGNISVFYCLAVTLSFLSDLVNPFLIMRWSEVYRRSLLTLVHCGAYSKTQVEKIDAYKNVSAVFETLPPRELRGNYVTPENNSLSEASLKYFSANYLHNDI